MEFDLNRDHALLNNFSMVNYQTQHQNIHRNHLQLVCHLK